MIGYAKKLMKTPCKIIVIITSVLLVAFGVYGSVNIDQSFDVLVLGLKGSAYVKYFTYRDKAFPTGIPVSIVLDTPSNYTEDVLQQQYAQLSEIVDGNKYIKSDHYNWLASMRQWSKQNNVTITGTSFYPALFLFLREHPYFFVDIKFTDEWMGKFQIWTQTKRLLVTQHNVDAIFEQFLIDNRHLLSNLILLSSKPRSDGVSGNQTFSDGVSSINQTINMNTNFTELLIQSPTPLIKASRLQVFTKDNPHSIYRKDAMLSLRKDLQTNSRLPVYGIGYHYIFVEQFVIILPDTIRNLAICACAILFITLPYLVNPKVTFFVFFGFVCLMFELFGVMLLWGVSLNAISMIVIVMGIGFSVDYSAHIAHAFVVSNEKTSEKRVMYAMKTMGASVTMGGKFFVYIVDTH